VCLKIFDRDLIDNPRGKVKTIKVLFKTALPDQIKTTSGTLDNAHFRSWLLSILVKPFKKKRIEVSGVHYQLLPAEGGTSQ